jgi:hypothetical protein
VAYVAETAAAADDTDVLALALGQGRVSITDDKDFGFHAIREARDACGVLLYGCPRWPLPTLSGACSTSSARKVVGWNSGSPW